jgi:hypothetical protein
VLEQFFDAVDGVSYAVDADDRIIAVGRCEWDRLPVVNSAPEPRTESLVGRHLFEFVSDPELRKAYRVLADRITSTGEPAVIAVRCDIPDAPREVRLSIDRLLLRDNGPGLLFQVQVVGQAASPPSDVFDIEALMIAIKQGSGLPIVTVCSYCRQVRRPGSRDEDDWIQAEEYRRLGGSPRVRISHGVCADCDAARFPDR